jgi:hypothetical protein
LSSYSPSSSSSSAVLLLLLNYLVGDLKGDGSVDAAFVVFLGFLGAVDSSSALALASTFGGGGG